MTGFGIGEASLQGAGDKITVEIRAVNHRFLDIRVRAPSQLPDLGNCVESLARERLTRGRFDISVRVDGRSIGSMAIDRERARSAFTALKSLRDELAPEAEVPLSMLASIPDLFVPSIESEADALKSSLTNAFEVALKNLDAMRIREGAALTGDLRQRLQTIGRLVKAIIERSPVVIESYKKRLKERAERLRLASDIDLDGGRLEQEVAMFADRIDIAEELTRLEGHASHFESFLVQAKTSAEPIGRRLDFLLQEMAREANTIGSKSQDISIAHAVVELKAEIERMREQAQNVE